MRIKTENALRNLNFSKELIESIDKKKPTITISKMKLMKDSELEELGLNNEQISLLREQSRPPIPAEIEQSVRFKARFTCTLCRKNKSGTIIHHIVPWEKSHSHDEENLILLCPNCHSDVHTKRDLGQNFDPNTLKFAKKTWEKSCENLDKVAHSISYQDSLRWEWFNVPRIIELLNYNIKKNQNFLNNIDEVEGYLNNLINRKLINKSNYLIDENQINILNEGKKLYFNIQYSYVLAGYFGWVLFNLVKNLHFLDLTEYVKNQTYNLKDIISVNQLIILRDVPIKISNRKDNIKFITNSIQFPKNNNCPIQIVFDINEYYFTSDTAFISCDAEKFPNQIFNVAAKVMNIQEEKIENTNIEKITIRLSCFALWKDS